MFGTFVRLVIISAFLLLVACGSSPASNSPPTTTTSISDCNSLQSGMAAPGDELRSGRTYVLSIGGTYLSPPSGSLRLIATGAGRIVLTGRSTAAIIFQGNVGSVPITQDFTAPANLLVEPNPTQTITVSICTP